MVLFNVLKTLVRLILALQVISVYAAQDPQPVTEMGRRHYTLAKQTELESIVLLENRDNILYLIHHYIFFQIIKGGGIFFYCYLTDFFDDIVGDIQEGHSRIASPGDCLEGGNEHLAHPKSLI